MNSSFPANSLRGSGFWDSTARWRRAKRLWSGCLWSCAASAACGCRRMPCHLWLWDASSTRLRASRFRSRFATRMFGRGRRRTSSRRFATLLAPACVCVVRRGSCAIRTAVLRRFPCSCDAQLSSAMTWCPSRSSWMSAAWRARAWGRWRKAWGSVWSDSSARRSRWAIARAAVCGGGDGLGSRIGRVRIAGTIRTFAWTRWKTWCMRWTIRRRTPWRDSCYSRWRRCSSFFSSSDCSDARGSCCDFLASLLWFLGFFVDFSIALSMLHSRRLQRVSAYSIMSMFGNRRMMFKSREVFQWEQSREYLRSDRLAYLRSCRCVRIFIAKCMMQSHSSTARAWMGDRWSSCSAERSAMSCSRTTTADSPIQ